MRKIAVCDWAERPFGVRSVSEILLRVLNPSYLT